MLISKGMIVGATGEVVKNLPRHLSGGVEENMFGMAYTTDIFCRLRTSKGQAGQRMSSMQLSTAIQRVLKRTDADGRSGVSRAAYAVLCRTARRRPSSSFP